MDCSKIIPGLHLLGWAPPKHENLLDDVSEATTPDTVGRSATAAGNGSSRTFLCEIVGAVGLSTRAKTTIDPFCVVRLRGIQIHRTKPVQDDGNPIWTVQNGSLFLLEIPPDEDNKTVLVIDICHSVRRLGTVSVPIEKIQKGTGSREVFPVQPTANSDIKRAILALRFRPASRDDIDFVKSLNGSGVQKSKRKPSSCAALDINFTDVKAESFLARSVKTDDQKQKWYRMKPYPDPDRPKETEWMTKEMIYHEYLKPSKNWVSAGNGSMGTVYLEILAANDLPNLDSVAGAIDLTDTFVAVAFEDNMVRTDVIYDELNPKWMPWTTRAFAFLMHHPTSFLMIGAFDYDPEPLQSHDAIGRVTINLANFESGTVYVLHYKLQHDPRKPDEDRGDLIVRLRIEWNDEAEAMKAAYSSPPRFLINVDNDRSYGILKYLTRGMVDMEQPSLDSVKLYAKELLSNKAFVMYALDVMMEIYLWRGRLYLTPSLSIWFPMHSIAVFVAAAVVVEKPHFALPVMLYSIAWLMLWINFHASRNPYPWKRVLPSSRRNMVVLFGKSIHPPVRIRANQGIVAGNELEKLDSMKAERMATLISTTLSFVSKVSSVYSKTKLTSINLSTTGQSWGIFSFFNDQFYYPHMILKMMCQNIRMFRNFMNWKSFYTHKVAMDCLLFGTLWFVLPVNMLLKWVFRILLWTLLGPWIKLLDVFFVKNWYLTRDQMLEKIEKNEEVPPQVPDFEWVMESDWFFKLGKSGRIVAEKGHKLIAMREHRFGKYSEEIPKVELEEASIPLPASFAYPVRESELTCRKWNYAPGQTLTGEMIETQEEIAFP